MKTERIGLDGSNMPKKAKKAQFFPKIGLFLRRF